MSLIVTRPKIEQVIWPFRAWPGSIEEHPGSVREISAHSIPRPICGRVQMFCEPGRRRSPGDLPSGTQLQIERMTPEIFPGVHPQPTGGLRTADLYELRELRVKPEMARVPGAGIIEVQASDTRRDRCHPRNSREVTAAS